MSENEQAQADDAAEAEAEAETAEDAEPDEIEDEEIEAESAEDEESGLQEGDFIRVAYTIRTKEDGRVIDTTSEEVAEEAEIDTEEHDFNPRVIALGAGHIFQPVEEAFEGAAVGDEGVVEISAEEAFGVFDPDEVETVKADRIPEDDRYPGAQVQIDGRQGHVEAIIGGRARVDFNHPLAGEDLEYEYEILEAVTEREEQAQSLLAMYLQQEPEVRIETVTEEEEVQVEGDEDDEDDEDPEFETEEVEKDVLYVEATPQMQMNQQWMFQKQQIAQEIMDRLDLDRVVVEEVIEGGMMGGMGGMMGGLGGAGGGDLEEALDDVDVDAEELAEELDEE